MAFIAWKWRVFPTTRWAIPMVGIIFVSLLALFNRDLIFFVTTIDLPFIALVVGDLAFLAGRRCPIDVDRQMQRAASIAKPHSVTLVLDNSSKKYFRLEVCDDLPEELLAEPPNHSVTLLPERDWRSSIY